MIFVDSGAFVALYRNGDQYHDEAFALWATIRSPLVTSNHIIDEVATTLGRRADFRYAHDRILALYGLKNLEIVASTHEDELNALRWMYKFADQRITFTDCVSFAIMKRRHIRTAFTFDRHFRTAGFDAIGLR